MSTRLAALALLAICETCLGVEPPIPLPPETSVIPPAPVDTRPALPAFDRQPADSASTPVAPAPGPRVVRDVGVAPVISPYWDTGYLPESIVPPTNAGLHVRHPYYSYRRPWYPAGPPSLNVSIVW